jgi:hypothetical protein
VAVVIDVTEGGSRVPVTGVGGQDLDVDRWYRLEDGAFVAD